MSKKEVKKNLVIDAHAINYARIASPVAKYETLGKKPTDLEWKVDILIDEATYETIQETYSNLRKKATPITAKKYKEIYKVDMPKGIDEPMILKLSQDVAVEYKDAKTEEKKLMEKPQPKVLLKQEDGKARDITFEEYIGNGSKGKVLLSYRGTQYNGKPIDVIELGSIMVTDLVEVEVKPGQGGTKEPNLKDAFGLDEIEESDAVAPEPNEKGLNSKDFDDDIPFDDGDDNSDDY